MNKKEYARKENKLQNRRGKGTIRLQNDKYNFKGLTAKEIDIMIYLLAVNEKVTFQDIKKACKIEKNWTYNTYWKFFEDIKKTGLQVEYNTVWKEAGVKEEEPEFNYTVIELEEVFKLKSKHQKLLYIFIKKLKGRNQINAFRIAEMKLREKLDIPNYKTGNIKQRILNPMEETLKTLKVDIKEVKGYGNKTLYYDFVSIGHKRSQVNEITKEQLEKYFKDNKIEYEEEELPF